LVNQKQSSHQHQEQKQEIVDPLADEKIGPELLLRGWKKTLEIVNGAIEHNKKSGVRYPEGFVSFLDTKPMNIMSMDPVRYFVEKALNKNTEENTRKKVVYESYIKFCSHFKLPVESDQSFSRKLTEVYGLSYKQFRDVGEKVNCWVGVKVSDWLALEDESQVTLEDVNKIDE
jgi:hypothetical protein